MTDHCTHDGAYTVEKVTVDGETTYVSVCDCGHREPLTPAQTEALLAHHAETWGVPTS